MWKLLSVIEVLLQKLLLSAVSLSDTNKSALVRTPKFSGAEIMLLVNDGVFL